MIEWKQKKKKTKTKISQHIIKICRDQIIVINIVFKTDENIFFFILILPVWTLSIVHSYAKLREREKKISKKKKKNIQTKKKYEVDFLFVCCFFYLMQRNFSVFSSVKKMYIIKDLKLLNKEKYLHKKISIFFPNKKQNEKKCLKISVHKIYVSVDPHPSPSSP